MRLWLVAVGFVSLLGQVALLRELAVASYGVELVYVLALGVWLCGSALGAAALGRLDARALWLALAALLPASVALLRGARGWLGEVPGAYLPLPAQLGLAALAVLPSAVLLGALFPASIRRPPSLPLARAYAVESAGAMVGGAASSLLLAAGVSNWFAALACSTAALGASLLPWRGRPRWLLPVAVPLGAGVLACLASAGAADRAMTRWSHPALVATLDSPYGRVTIERRESLVSVFENDALAFETDATDAEELVNLSAVEHPAPRRMLVLGGAASGVVEAALRHGPDSLDAVELDEASHRLVVPLLPDSARAALASPRVRLRFTDPRRLVEQAAESWDLILVAMPEPASAAASRFYSREFFEAARRHLAPAGILAFRLPASENLWTESLARRTASVVHALPFAHVRALPASRLVVIASDAPLEKDPEVLAGRLRSRATSARAATPEFLLYVHRNDRREEIARRLTATHAAPNTDTRPVCFRHAAVLWLARVSPVLAQRLEGVDESSPLPWAALALVAAVLLVCRLVPAARAAGAVAYAGLAGMVLETGVLLQYQAHSGVLFEDLGLLLTLFMAGLVGGAWATDRWGLRGPASHAAPALAIAAIAAVVGLRAAEGAALRLGEAGALLAVCGLGCGALFAGRAREGGRGLYASDLAGGCAGALLGSLLLFPLLGLAPAAAALVALALLAL